MGLGSVWKDIDKKERRYQATQLATVEALRHVLPEAIDTELVVSCDEWGWWRATAIDFKGSSIERTRVWKSRTAEGLVTAARLQPNGGV